jgi:signal peptidase I
MKGILNYFWETIKIVVFALIIVLPIRVFLFQPFIVRGASMEPSFHEADYLIVDQISYRFREPERGEVIVFYYPQDPQKRHIKRIIGLPEEEVIIEEEKIFIISNGEKSVLEEDYLPLQRTSGEEKIILAEEEYFVMGDNRSASFDSRNWGSLPRENIIGKVFFQISPFSIFSKVEIPEY